jgi:hypothetical protein
MKSKLLRAFVLAVAASAVSTVATAGELKMSMENGRVTIIADSVPLRQILLEWARIGQSKILNIDKVSGPALTLQLVDTPEKDALDILLRAASGYIAVPRTEMVANASMYDRITIMATSRAPAPVAAAAPPPTFQRPPQPIDESDEPINVVPAQPQPNPVVGQYPGMPPGAMPPGAMPNGAQPPNGQTPALQSQPGMPTTPQTSPRPGMLPAPGAPNGVPNPYQPQVIRPGPGGPGGPGGGPGAF